MPEELRAINICAQLCLKGTLPDTGDEVMLLTNLSIPDNLSNIGFGDDP